MQLLQNQISPFSLKNTGSFTLLTYLKLPTNNLKAKYTGSSDQLRLRLIDIFRQCPNLIYLFLDICIARDLTCITAAVLKAVDYCKQLETLVISNKAEMPATLLSWDNDINNADQDDIIYYSYTKKKSNQRKHRRHHSNDNPSTFIATTPSSLTSSSSVPFKSKEVNNNSSSNKKERKGLTKLILDVGGLVFDFDFIDSILQKAHKTLELFHLIGTVVPVLDNNNFYFNNNNNKRLLQRLGSYGIPNLCELSLSACFDGDASVEETNNGLIQFIFKCPRLQAIRINGPGSNRVHQSLSHMRAAKKNYKLNKRTSCPLVNDQVLEAIGTYCPLLRHLYIDGLRQHTRDGLLRFATMVGGIKRSQLVELAIDMERKSVLTLVNELQSLRRLTLLPSRGFYMIELFEDRVVVQKTLINRGGELIEHTQR
ncbi:hypothetical protein BDA99DRAFT_558411 [Phascolomyces articulosus]|uniref:Uncharacterized protein n=1 Tax=Phascolomyces articulosus TaxID=60185 RepID=A0AAD5KDC1_9FUNG|nr:hypothetical protein BDA99DRAFT_558411 [Phascolomyces articulosus]